MAKRSDATDLGWEQQQRADRVQQALERGEWLKDFALALVLIVLTIAVATLLAAWHLPVKEAPAGVCRSGPPSLWMWGGPAAKRTTRFA
jgi:hypothetical protein